LNELVIACELRKRARVLGVMVKEWSWWLWKWGKARVGDGEGGLVRLHGLVFGKQRQNWTLVWIGDGCASMEVMVAGGLRWRGCTVVMWCFGECGDG
jgi:hypothetical protein